jgi:hypothetical protein
MSLAALIGIDKERYDQGNKFLSQNRFLQGLGLDKAPITFNESSINTGIMGPRVYPYPPIIPQDGGGIINPNRNSKFDYEFNALGGLNNPDNVPLTDEEREILNAQKNKDRLAMAGKLGLFALNPIGYALGKGAQKAFGFVKDKFFSGDGDGSSGGGGKGNKGKTTVDYYAPGGGYEGSDEQDRDNEDTASTAGADTSRSDDSWSSSPFEYGGRVGYRNGGYSSEDNEEQQAIDQASFDAGNRTDDYTDMYSGGDNNNPPPPISSNDKPQSNLNFNLVEYTDPAFSYANRFGTLGGRLDTFRTIEEEEPVGTVGYYSPSGNFGLGYGTDKGFIGTANIGNLNLGVTGTEGPTFNYSGAFGNDAGRFGVNYNRDSGINLGVSYNKKFNNGGIVGLYR